jgi:hypothetical protein
VGHASDTLTVSWNEAGQTDGRTQGNRQGAGLEVQAPRGNARLGCLLVLEDAPSVSVATEIDAPPEAVWQVLTAFGRYAAWHPTLSLDGASPAIEPGARLAFRLSGGSAGDQAFSAELTEVAPPRLLAWKGGVEGVFLGRHTFELRALPGGGTHFTDSECWSGTMAASVIARSRAALEEQYARSAAALKAQAERGRTARR